VIWKVRIAVALLAAVMSQVAARSSAGENVWTTHGPPNAVSAIALDPVGVSLYSATTGVSPVAYGSNDHGLTWTPLAQGPAGSWISAIAVDATRTQNVYAAVSSVPGASPFGTLYRSVDGGQSWSLTAGIGATVRAIASSRLAPGTLYAAASTCRCIRLPCFAGMDCRAGILKSLDFGETWTSLDAGLSGRAIVAVAIDPMDSNRIFAGGDAGAFLSVDGGTHWSAIETGFGTCVSVTSIAADPRANGVLYVAAVSADRSTCGAVLRSEDGGHSWTPTDLQVTDLSSLAIDSSDPESVFAGVGVSGTRASVFRTTDRGHTWTQIGSVFADAGPLAPVALIVERAGRVLHVSTANGVFDYEIVPGARPPIVPGRSRTTHVLPGRP
jgi:photosystem II stability/assembly factor-like uncharacterized protein